MRKSSKMVFAFGFAGLLCVLICGKSLFAEVTGEFAGGSGTEDDPYLVKHFGHLNNVREHLDKHFKQISNIDLSIYDGDRGWEPIGNFRRMLGGRFTGTYDGNGYKISNLIINNSGARYAGLFEKIGRGSVKNVNLYNVEVVGGRYTGGLAGHNYLGEISNVRVYGNVSGEKYTGAVVGKNSFHAGIINSCFVGKVESDRSAGGLIGFNMGDVIKSYAAGKVSGRGGLGGLAAVNTGNISNSYTSCDVVGRFSLGGLVGHNMGKIKKSYAVGSLEYRSDRSVGGLVGKNKPHPDVAEERPAVVGNSYYDKNTTGQDDTEKGTPKTTEQMMQRETFEEWDFEEVWTIDEGESFPYLQWQRYKDPTERLEMYLGLEKEEIKSGMPVFVSIGLRNVSEEPISLTETTSERDFSFEVRDSKGNQVDKLRYQKIFDKKEKSLAKTKITIMPKETKEYEFNLSRRFDLIGSGEYFVQARREIMQGMFKLSSKEESFKIHSGPRKPKKDVVEWKEKWGDPKEGLMMSIDLPKQEIEAGMPVMAVVKLRNISEETQNFVYIRGWGPNFQFYVEDPLGKSLDKFRSHLPLIGSAMVKKIPAGQQWEYKYNISRLFDMTIEGKYTVYVELVVPKSERKAGEDNRTILQSNDKVFSINDPTEKGKPTIELDPPAVDFERSF